MIGWLLDANVVSELSKEAPAPAVAAWAVAQPLERLYVSALTLGEFEYGIHSLPSSSPRRPMFEAALARVEARFRGRLLSVTDEVVRRWGRICGHARLATRQRPAPIDMLLAATAIEAGLYLATRNVRGVRASGAAVFNPWSDDPARFPLSS